MSPLPNGKTFVKAGDAVFTVADEDTGNRLIFRVPQHAEKDLGFMKVLCGPDLRGLERDGGKGAGGYSEGGCQMVWRNDKGWESRHSLGRQRSGELARLGRRLDWLVAQVTKYRDGWRCQKCGKRLFGAEAHCAHVLSRSAGLLLRWDRANTIVLCCRDHIEWTHAQPREFREWFQAQFPDRFAYLQQRRRQCGKLDEQARRALMTVLEQELIRLGGWP